MKPKQIKKLRESLGLTQGQFARKIGTTRVSVCRWENATYAEPNGTLRLQAGWESAIRLLADIHGIQL